MKHQRAARVSERQQRVPASGRVQLCEPMDIVRDWKRANGISLRLDANRTHRISLDPRWPHSPAHPQFPSGRSPARPRSPASR